MGFEVATTLVRDCKSHTCRVDGSARSTTFARRVWRHCDHCRHPRRVVSLRHCHVSCCGVFYTRGGAWQERRWRRLCLCENLRAWREREVTSIVVLYLHVRVQPALGTCCVENHTFAFERKVNGCCGLFGKNRVWRTASDTHTHAHK